MIATAPTKRGGDRHEISSVLAVLTILLSLIAFLPAPGRAADVPADRLLIGALPPPSVTLLTAERHWFRLCRKADRDPSFQHDIQLQEDPAQDDSEPGIVLTPDEYRRLKQGVSGLSSEEYQAVKKLISRGGATPWQVAAVNFAVIATGILVVGLAWIALLWIVRRMFDFWFDADVYKHTWPSVVVIVTLIVTTCIVIAAAVMR